MGAKRNLTKFSGPASTSSRRKTLLKLIMYKCLTRCNHLNRKEKPPTSACSCYRKPRMSTKRKSRTTAHSNKKPRQRIKCKLTSYRRTNQLPKATLKKLSWFKFRNSWSNNRENHSGPSKISKSSAKFIRP